MPCTSTRFVSSIKIAMVLRRRVYRASGPLMHLVLPARICRLDDDADGLLVKALETAFALQIFQVTPDGAFSGELAELLVRNEPATVQSLEPPASDGPALAFGKGLLQKRKIGERIHRLNLRLSELLAEQLVIESAFQMMHPGLEKALAVQPDPEPDRS